MVCNTLGALTCTLIFHVFHSISHMFSSLDYDQILELIPDQQSHYLTMEQRREDIMSELTDLGPMDLIELGL